MNKIRITFAIVLNSIIDLYIYIKYSGILAFNSHSKLLAVITFNYHTIEKGLSMQDLRLGFGKDKITIILKRLNQYLKRNYDTNSSQFIAACSVLNQYYDIHQKSNFDVESYFSKSNFITISKYADKKLGGTKKYTSKFYFKNDNASYEQFSQSRHSVRQFSSVKISLNEIKEAIEIAKHCPSACNRQVVSAYYVNNKETIDEILSIQCGLDSSAKYVHQLLVIASDRSHFFTSGERYQHFIEGGIFIQSLILALHFKKIAACPLHWSVNFQKDIALRKIVGNKKSEKVVALIAIGNIDLSFKVPYSKRKNLEEIFFEVN